MRKKIFVLVSTIMILFTVIYLYNTNKNHIDLEMNDSIYYRV